MTRQLIGNLGAYRGSQGPNGDAMNLWQVLMIPHSIMYVVWTSSSSSSTLVSSEKPLGGLIGQTVSKVLGLFGQHWQPFNRVGRDPIGLFHAANIQNLQATRLVGRSNFDIPHFQLFLFGFGKELPNIFFTATDEFVESFRSIDNLGFSRIQHLANFICRAIKVLPHSGGPNKSMPLTSWLMIPSC
jgi:hypothetical protein